MEYSTYIFEESKKKIIIQWLIVIGILVVILAILLLKVFWLKGIGALTIGTLGYRLFKTRSEDLKDNGINNYGQKSAIITITEEYLEIKDKRIGFNEVSDLVIYVDEYYGMPKQFFGSYHGGNNEIKFKHKGVPYSFNYLIKSKKDLEFVEVLVSKIEEKYPHNS